MYFLLSKLDNIHRWSGEAYNYPGMQNKGLFSVYALTISLHKGLNVLVPKSSFTSDMLYSGSYYVTSGIAEV